MKVLALAAPLLVACGTDVSALPVRTLQFGPFTLAPGQEDLDLCVGATLNNDEPIFVNAVSMIGAPGIHHSNWFWVPGDNATFAAFPDGAFSCAKGNGLGVPFDQQTAAFYGGVLFAQSTQETYDTEDFSPGDAIYLPPHAKILAQLHLLNTTDNTESVPISLSMKPIAASAVTTYMSGFSTENMGIAIPPNMQSSFTVTCDLSTNAGGVPWSFHMMHALAHYHQWGTGLTFAALRDSDGGADVIWSTDTGIGNELGGTLDPPFDMTGHSKVQLTCDYDNNTNNTIYWGNGGAEMCIFFGYTDSPYVWTAGLINTTDNPGTPTIDSNGVADFVAPTCTGVIAIQANTPANDPGLAR